MGSPLEKGSSENVPAKRLESKESLKKMADKKFNLLMMEIGSHDTGYRMFDSKEPGVVGFGLRTETANSDLGKHTQEVWHYKGDIVHYRKTIDNKKGKVVKGIDNTFGGTGKEFEYNTGYTGIEATLSYDKKTGEFRYSSSRSKGDARFPEDSPYALKILQRSPGADLTHPKIIPASKAIEIMDRMLDEIRASKRKEPIEKSKVLLSQLKDDTQESSIEKA